MNCAEAQQSWHDRRDGAAPVEPRAALELHLRSCAACRAYCRQMDAVDGALSALRDLSRDVADREPVAASHGRESVMPRRFRPRPVIWRLVVWRAGGIAAALALIVGAGFYLSRRDAAPTIIPIAEVAITSPSEASFAQVVLTAESAERFIPVAQATSQPNVHVFVLYRTAEGRSGPRGLSDIN